ncbi:MAG: hypothetical protein Q4C12_03765 [Clostridia bacterium]|nr:hypothetical protein [Clostridia bacterium]
MTKASFCELVEVDGKRRVKFKRQARRPVDGYKEMDLRSDGFEYRRRRPKIRDWPNEEDAIKSEGHRFRRNSRSYYDYAKDLAEHFKIDLRTYNLCVEEKRYIGVFGKEDFEVFKEDLLFLHDCRKTVLRDYNDYFKERFFDGIHP